MENLQMVQNVVLLFFPLSGIFLEDVKGQHLSADISWSPRTSTEKCSRSPVKLLRLFESRFTIKWKLSGMQLTIQREQAKSYCNRSKLKIWNLSWLHTGHLARISQIYAQFNKRINTWRIFPAISSKKILQWLPHSSTTSEEKESCYWETSCIVHEKLFF